MLRWHDVMPGDHAQQPPRHVGGVPVRGELVKVLHCDVCCLLQYLHNIQIGMRTFDKVGLEVSLPETISLLCLQTMHSHISKRSLRCCTAQQHWRHRLCECALQMTYYFSMSAHFAQYW